MTDLLCKPDEDIGGTRAESWGWQCNPPILVVLPPGSLRIGGDSPDGLVLVGTAPAARVVDLFDRETKALVATTTSASDGTYAFTGLSARAQGYDVVIRGVIASGERDDIIPGVHPG